LKLHRQQLPDHQYLTAPEYPSVTRSRPHDPSCGCDHSRLQITPAPAGTRPVPSTPTSLAPAIPRYCAASRRCSVRVFARRP
jgi:hypothetical protein